jgi:hypothetical protein
MAQYKRELRFLADTLEVKKVEAAKLANGVIADVKDDTVATSSSTEQPVAVHTRNTNIPLDTLQRHAQARTQLEMRRYLLGQSRWAVQVTLCIYACAAV